MKKGRTIRILTANDLHCGSKAGLTPPCGWREPYRAALEPHWNFWVSTLKQIGRVDLAVLNGDLPDGPGKRDTTSLLTTDVGEQIDWVGKALKHIRTDNIRIVRGTGYHVESGTCLEDLVAKELGMEALDEYRLFQYGRRLHWRHVVGRSDIPYGQYTQVGKELINDLLQADMEQYEKADILLRAHVHYCVGILQLHPGTGFLRQAWTLPGMQLRRPGSSYVRGLRTWMYHVGVTLTEIEPNGEVFVRPIPFPIKQYAKIEYETLFGEKPEGGVNREKAD